MASGKTAALKKSDPVATTTVTPAAKKATKATKATGTAVALTKTSGALVDANAIRESLRAQAAEMNNRTAPASGNKIQPVPGFFKLPDGSKVPELKAVIVDFATVHNFYPRAFDPKNIVPPDCFAVGVNPKDMAPIDESPNKQADTCQTCPNNEFGSSGDGKACKNGRRLALLPINDDGTDVDAEADMLVLDVSPTALKGFDAYVQQLARLHQLPPVAFITTITLDPNVEYAKVQFSDPQPVASLGEAMARQAEAKELVNQAPDFSNWKPVEAPKGRGTTAAGKTARR